VANQGVFDSQAGPKGISTDSARNGENTARAGSLLNSSTKKGSGLPEPFLYYPRICCTKQQTQLRSNLLVSVCGLPQGVQGRVLH